MLILHCEDSLEGIFTAIYDAFVYKKQMQQPYKDDIEIVMGEGCLTLFAEEREIVVNAEKIHVTGKKLDQKIYYHHSDYVGGMKDATLREKLNKKPEQVIELAVKGMLPK